MKVQDLKEIEVGGIDLSEFEGNLVTIQKLETKTVKTVYHESGTAEALLVESEPVTTVATDDGDVDIRASELFNLKCDEDGKAVGYSSSPKSKLQKFMKRQKVSSPKELVGTQVRLRIREKTNADGTTAEFLGFVL